MTAWIAAHPNIFGAICFAAGIFIGTAAGVLVMALINAAAEDFFGPEV